jgi:hypothetical protein
MKALKKRTKPIGVTLAGPSTNALRPTNEKQYPREIEGESDKYYRLWVRPRVIVYEVYNAAHISVGFLCCNTSEEKLFTARNSYGNWRDMEAYVEKNENNYSWGVIAK